MKKSIFGLLALFVLQLHVSNCLFEDQAFKFDWKQQFIGAAQDVLHYSASKNKDLLLLRTESNVISALDGDTGRMIWRQVFAEGEKLLDISLTGRQVTSLTYDAKENSTFTRSWSVSNGALSSERRIQTIVEDQNILEGFLYDGTPHLVHRTAHNSLKIHAVYDNDEKIEHSFSTGAGEDKDGFSCNVLSDSYVCVSALLSSVYSTKLPLSGNAMTMASLTTLGIAESPQSGKHSLKIDHFSARPNYFLLILGIPISRFGDDQIKVSLTSGSLAILTFKSGKFSSINTIKGKSSGTVLYAAKCKSDDTPILAEQKCENFQNCEKTLTLSKGSNQNNYDVDADRGLIEHSWVFCDKDDPDAFQLILRSQDGSLVSVTPLGNIMWKREEGLGSIKEVKLINRDTFDDVDETYDQDKPATENSDHVLEMFLKRLKHHASQIQIFLEKIKLGKVGLSTILLGNPDASYNDFEMRKMIVAFTSHGGLYGLDSKSGKVLWQRMSPCMGQNSNPFLFLQRSGSQFGLPPLATLICTTHSGVSKIIKFNPSSGTLSADQSQTLAKPVHKAILIHQSTPEDHIRPILLVSEGQEFTVEPKDAMKSLKSISGKIFVANLDADHTGIQGNRLSLSDDEKSIEKVPVWSFSSANSKIIHLNPKPSEEVVHSQGRVMADRSVLFKYINPNLAFVLCEGQDSSGKTFINIYLLDLVTGRTIFSANHKRVQGPYHAVHSENWVIYTYYNEKSRRAELGSLELFEGKTQSNATVFSSLRNTVSPLVERQSYVLGPSYVTALKDTVTEKGITTKNLLMATAAGSVYNIPRQFLDPRRPSINTPPEMREPGLPPYVPELVFPPEVILNYNQTLSRISGIVTAATGLESTSVVFVYGLDLYSSSVNPSKAFDLLKDDFEHYVIASVLLGLLAAAYVTRKLSQRKMLMSAWK